MKVLITNGWHDDNKGDCGIVLGIMEALEAAGKLDISILSEFSAKDYRFKNGYRHILEVYPRTQIVPSSWPIFPVNRFKSIHKRSSVEKIVRHFFRNIDQRKELKIISHHLTNLKHTYNKNAKAQRHV